MNKTDNERLLDAIRKVSEELCLLSDEEFKKELERHKDGDIARMLLETNALCVQDGDTSREEV